MLLRILHERSKSLLSLLNRLSSAKFNIQAAQQGCILYTMNMTGGKGDELRKTVLHNIQDSVAPRLKFAFMKPFLSCFGRQFLVAPGFFKYVS